MIDGPVIKVKGDKVAASAYPPPHLGLPPPPTRGVVRKTRLSVFLGSVWGGRSPPERRRWLELRTELRSELLEFRTELSELRTELSEL